MGAKRKLESRANEAVRRAMWLTAEAAAVKRPEVAVLFKAVRGADRVCANSPLEVNVEPLVKARSACVAALKELGVEVP